MPVEAALIKWLSERTQYQAFHSRPAQNAPPKLFTLQRTGGLRESVATEAPEIAIQCWAPTTLESAQMAEELDRLMPQFAFEPDIHKVDHIGTYEFPGENREPRYQSAYQITVRSCI